MMVSESMFDGVVHVESKRTVVPTMVVTGMAVAVVGSTYAAPVARL